MGLAGWCWLADAEVVGVERLDGPAGSGEVHVRLSAAPFSEGGTPDQPTHHARGIVLRLQGSPAVSGSPLTHCLGRLSQGHVQLDGLAGLQRHLPLPCALQGPLTLHLQFANGSGLQVRASACLAAAPRPGDVFESMAC